MARKKSVSCFRKKDGEPKIEYASFEDAYEAAENDLERYKSSMSPSECPTCNYWHLAPSRQKNNTHGKDVPSGANGTSSIRKSITCDGQKSGKPLTEYDSFEDAQKGAEYVLELHNNVSHPYRCPTCPSWHLAPRNRRNNKRNDVPSGASSSSERAGCTCDDKISGKPVTKYHSFEDAQEYAAYALGSYESPMSPYECSTCHYWYLVPPREESHFWIGCDGERNDNERSRSGQKSTSCFGTQNTGPRTEYESLRDAKKAAVHAELKYGNIMVAYCCSVCPLWHIAPQSRQTISESSAFGCQCQAADGSFKTTYRQEVGATRRADIIWQEDRSVYLRAYQCPSGNGWHLSSKSELEYLAMAPLAQNAPPKARVHDLAPFTSDLVYL